MTFSIKSLTSSSIPYSGEKNTQAIADSIRSTSFQDLPRELGIKILMDTDLPTFLAVKNTSSQLRKIYSYLENDELKKFGLPEDFPKMFTSLSETDKEFLKIYEHIIKKLFYFPDYDLIYLSQSALEALKKSPYLLPSLKEKIYLYSFNKYTKKQKWYKDTNIHDRLIEENSKTIQLNLLSTDTNDRFRGKAAAHPFATTDILKKLSTDPITEVRAQVAANPSASADILKKLSTDPITEVRAQVAANPSASADILKTLMNDSIELVLTNLARNPSTPAETLKKLYENRNKDVLKALAGNPSTPAEILTQLYQDGDGDVLKALAGNPSIPTETLEKLYENRNRDVLKALAGNPSMSVETLTLLSKNIQYRCGDLWCGLFNYELIEVKRLLAGNPSTSVETLTQLIKDSESIKDSTLIKYNDIKFYMARNPRVIKALIFYLIDDSDIKSKTEIEKNLKEWKTSYPGLLPSHVANTIREKIELLSCGDSSSDTLDLSSCNELKTLPTCLFDLTHLKNLKLNGCKQLTCPPELFGKLTNLENLELKDCLGLINNFSQLTAMKAKMPEKCIIHVNGRSLAIEAVQNGDVESLKVFVNSPDIDLNQKNSIGVTYLTNLVNKAVEKGHGEALKVLVSLPGIDWKAKNSQNLPYWIELAIQAVKKGHCEVLKVLVNVPGIDLNQKYWQSMTVAMYTAENGDSHVLKVLLETKGIDWKTKDLKGQTALMFAVQNGKCEMVQLLANMGDIDFLNEKDPNGWTAVMFAARSDNPDVLKVLLETKGVDWKAKNLQGQTALMLAALAGKLKTVQLLVNMGDIDFLNVKDLKGQTAVMLAAQGDNPNVLKFLFEKEGVDCKATNSQGQTTLMFAALAGKPEAVQFLVDKYDMNWVNTKDLNGRTAAMFAAMSGNVQTLKVFETTNVSLLTVKDAQDHTLLMLAAQVGSESAVSYLLRILERQSNLDLILNARNRSGQTVLMIAAAYSTQTNKKGINLLRNAPSYNAHASVLKVLLEIRNPDVVNTKDLQGWTALMYAAANGNTFTLGILLKADGIDLNAKNLKNQTAVMIAKQYDHVEVVKVLQDRINGTRYL